jgi:hypothetical protein
MAALKDIRALNGRSGHYKGGEIDIEPHTIQLQLGYTENRTNLQETGVRKGWLLFQEVIPEVFQGIAGI